MINNERIQSIAIKYIGELKIDFDLKIAIINLSLDSKA